jgi:hypothetical protein
MKFNRIIIAVVSSLVLVSCGVSESSEYEVTYTDYETLEAEVACLRDIIYSAESDLGDAEILVSDIDGEFYWIDETSAWYPDDIDDLEDLVDEADEAFVAIDEAKMHLDNLEWIIQDLQSSFSYPSC